MSSKKLNIIYDSKILINGLESNASRSGIYFTAYNILKELIKHENINVIFFCEKYLYKNLLKYIAEYFPETYFDVVIDKPIENKEYFYNKVKECKNAAVKNKNYLLKLILQLIIDVYGLFHYFPKLKYYNKFFKKYEKSGVFFSPIYAVPRIIKNGKIKKYTMLYDTIPLVLECYSNKKTWYNGLIKSLNYKDDYFAISESAKQDFLHYCHKINKNKIHTTYLACDEKFRPSDAEFVKSVEEKYNISCNSKYIFSLCTLAPHKNLIRMVKTFIEFLKKNNIDDLYFVLGGGHWEEFIQILDNEIENLGDYKDRIIKAGYIDDEDLPALYSGAEWFVYTSQYEGFGLPPLEAMSCGCPVITSNNSSLPEVVGDAGIMIDWDSDEQHIEAYEKYYFNSEIREENRQKGLERAKLFSWEKCVNTMLNEMKRGLYA